MIELVRALGVLAEAPISTTETVADAVGLPVPTSDEYTDVFLFQLYPYASVYLGPEGMIGGEARDRIAGFWRALRLTPPAEPDHLSALLGLYAALGEEEAAEPAEGARRVLIREARKALLWEHLLSWIPPYLDHMEAVAGASYRPWARLLRETLTTEAIDLGQPDRLSRHLDQAPALPDPRSEGGDAFLAGLLAPVRAGFILVRADLARGARELGLGLRLAERSYTLRALLGQDRDGTLAWLAQEARRAAVKSAGDSPTSQITRFWSERAGAAAVLLEDLSLAAKEASHVG